MTDVNTVTIARADVDSVGIDVYSNSMDAAAPWTLDELTSRVADATQRLGLLQANGQVADVPNARAIRWYTSTGLVRRPQQRGRVAFYGPAHLREIVAIKRLQSQGLTLEQVQQQLLGKSDDDVRVIAGVPDDLEAAVVVADVPARSFWAAEVADAVFSDALDVTGLPEPADVAAASVTAPADATRVALADPSGVTVVLPTTTRTPTADDVQAILSAVVETLVARGLLASSSATDPPAPKEEERS